MNQDGLIFLDPFPHSNAFPHFRRSNTALALAKTKKGIQEFKEKYAHTGQDLGLWVENVAQLEMFLKESEGLLPQWFFAFSGMKPSEIQSFGDFQGPTSMDLPDPRIQDFSILEPSVQVTCSSSMPADFSVIIPTFENNERLVKCLKAWSQQKEENFELIVVDDGSQVAVENLVRDLAIKNLTLIRLARPRPRQRGDQQFRAGIARNIGFKNSQGENIVFCDGDILVAENFLSQVKESLKTSDVVMPKRWHLKRQASEHFTEYAYINKRKDVLLSAGAHWEDFQLSTKPWSEHPTPWRWTSTFCLAMKRQTFASVQGFRKSFVTYGFEDTELGYRLAEKKYRFKMLNEDTFHLFQPPEQSEYQNNLEKKQALFKISADRFFRHHPKKEVFNLLKGWLT